MQNTPQDARENDGQYIKIRLNSLHPSIPIPFDIFVLINNRYVHYLRAGDKLEAKKIQNFEKKAPDSFFILATMKDAYRDYIKARLLSDDLATKEKAIILRESSLSMIEELYESPDVSRALDQSKPIIDEFIHFMEEQPDGMAHLIGLSSHDFYTYNHSLDVSIYALGLGHVVGYTKDEMRELGLGGMFHDIGKRHVSVDIICKDGPLDEIEWAQMQKHPEYGLYILETEDVSDAIKACCFEHHESFAGNGYPQALSGQEIHQFARIIAITDTYDAMTTKRSYNNPMTPTEALNMMKDKLASRYDKELLKAMYSILFKMKEAKIAV